MEEQTFYLVDYEFEGKPEFIKILESINDEDIFDETDEPRRCDLDFESTSWHHRDNIISGLKKKHPIENVPVLDIQVDITEEEYQIFLKVGKVLYDYPHETWETAIKNYKQRYQFGINNENWMNKLKINRVQLSHEYFPMYKSKNRV
jgi:hypothetical protein